MKQVRSITLTIFLMALPALAAAQALPGEVARFLARRETCDHFRGEEPYDKQRAAEINWSTCQSCRGTDAQLVNLKKKYSGDSNTLQKLDQLETPVEPADKAAARRFCRTLKKPKSLDDDS